MLKATLVLSNGKIYTFNPKNPKVKAIVIFEEK